MKNKVILVMFSVLSLSVGAEVINQNNLILKNNQDINVKSVSENKPFDDQIKKENTTIDKYKYKEENSTQTLEDCLVEAKEKIDAFNYILTVNRELPDETLKAKVQNSEFWKSLNEENKVKFAKNVMRWTIEGEEKIEQVKEYFKEYNLNNCRK